MSRHRVRTCCTRLPIRSIVRQHRLGPWACRLLFCLAILWPTAAWPGTVQAGSHGPWLWSDPATWDGAPPRSGDTVVIPSGKEVLLDVSPPPLAQLTIHGRLTFTDQDLALTAGAILIQGPGAALRAGTPAMPFQFQAVITLTGARPVIDPDGLGQTPVRQKALVVRDGGALELFGRQKDGPSWTQLALPAQAGDRTLSLATSVAWQPGDQVVVAPGGDEPLEAEVVTITAVRPVADRGAVVQIEPALRFARGGTVQQIVGRTVDRRAEVGLLSRNIVLQGDAQSDQKAFGGHVSIQPGGTARIEGVEFRRMGQAGVAHGYPIHWQMTMNRPHDTFRNNSIHGSFQRGVVLNGANQILVEGNVAHHVRGHAFVPAASGTEVGNRFIGNLAVLTRPVPATDYAFPTADGAASVQQEGRPGAFWLRNPNNVLIDNHAAGVVNGHGFFFDGGVVNGNMVFRGNVAHAIAADTPENRYTPLAQGSGLFLANVHGKQTAFDTFTAYDYAVAGAWVQGAVRLSGLVAAGGDGALLHGAATLEESLVIGHAAARAQGRYGNLRPYPVTQESAAGAVRIAAHADTHRPEIAGLTVVDHPGAAVVLESDALLYGSMLSGLQVDEAARRVRLQAGAEGDAPFRAALLDKDGSVGGAGEPGWITGLNSPLVVGRCSADEIAAIAICPLDALNHLEIALEGAQAGVLRTATLISPNGFRGELYPVPAGGSAVRAGFVPAGGHLTLSLPDADLAQAETLTLSMAGAQGQWTDLTLPLPVAPTALWLGQERLDPAPTEAALRAGGATGYRFDPAHGRLHLRLVNDAAATAVTVDLRARPRPPVESPAIYRPAPGYQAVPLPWADTAIGAFAGGGAFLDGERMVLDAANGVLGGPADDLHYVFQSVSGNVEVVARLDELSGGAAGIMLRSSLAGDAASVALLLDGDGGAEGTVTIRYRAGDGETAHAVRGKIHTAPIWLRLVRNGPWVTAYVADDGTAWGAPVATLTLTLPQHLYAGLAHASGHAQVRTMAGFGVAAIRSAGANATGPLPDPALVSSVAPDVMR